MFLIKKILIFKLPEITALRAKIAEMREMSLTQERDIRERVREEYNDLIQNIFNSTFQLRSKFDEFRYNANRIEIYIKVKSDCNKQVINFLKDVTLFQLW